MRGRQIKLKVTYVRFEDLDRQEQARVTRYRELLDKDVEHILGEIVERDRAEKAKQKKDSGKETK